MDSISTLIIRQTEETVAQEGARSTISATQARVRFGEVIKRAYVNQERVVVEKDGIPVVVILSLPYYEQLLQEVKLARFELLSREAGLEAERTGLTEEQLEQEMEVIREHFHYKSYG
jgi:prevent-host-death family protein